MTHAALFIYLTPLSPSCGREKKCRLMSNLMKCYSCKGILLILYTCIHTYCVYTFKILYLTKWGIAKLPSVTAIFNCLGRAISALHTTGERRNSLVLQGAHSLTGSVPMGANETMLRGNTGEASAGQGEWSIIQQLYVRHRQTASQYRWS